MTQNIVAMILCAGEGTRLRPLTHVLPKPIVPVGNRPILEYTLMNLKKHGITEVVINLSYKPEMIQSIFKDGSQLGIKIHYSVENKLMGTAGGLKTAERFFQNQNEKELLVTSGDGLSDIDFTSFIKFHKNKKSFCTIATKEVDSRFEYGVTIVNKNSGITRFVEKPTWSKVFSNRVNTGNYLFNKKIFQMIPNGEFFDFGNELFPKLMRGNLQIYSFNLKEFWTDIGNLTEYRRAQKVVLDKQISIPPASKKIKPNIWAGERTLIHQTARILPPCLIGDDCIINKNAIIGPYCVIGNNSKIGSDSVIRNSCVWERVRIFENVKLDNCIVTSGEHVPENTNFFDGILINKQ